MSKESQTVFKIVEDNTSSLLLRIYVDGRSTGTARAFPEKTNRNKLTVYPHRMEYPYSCTLKFPVTVWRQHLAWE